MRIRRKCAAAAPRGSSVMGKMAAESGCWQDRGVIGDVGGEPGEPGKESAMVDPAVVAHVGFLSLSFLPATFTILGLVMAILLT